MATNDSTLRTIEIQLTKGYVAIVDEQDADLALQPWYVADTSQVFYAARRPIHNGIKRNRFLHREILERKLGRKLELGELCDHINGNSLDNTRANLRVCDSTKNSQNTKPRKNKAGLKGAIYDKGNGKWRALIKVNGKKIYLGLFSTADMAHNAYCHAAKAYFGEYARFDAEGSSKDIPPIVKDCRNRTGYEGVTVSKSGKVFISRLTINGVRVMLGKFATPKAAYEAYCEAKKLKLTG